MLNLQEMLSAFLQHRREIVTRRSIYELAKAREKAHVLEGLGIALANIDQVVALIKAAKTPSSAVILNIWNVRKIPMNEKGIRLITMNGCLKDSRRIEQIK